MHVFDLIFEERKVDTSLGESNGLARASERVTRDIKLSPCRSGSGSSHFYGNLLCGA